MTVRTLFYFKIIIKAATHSIDASVVGLLSTQ